jgi:hypothetical protein
MHGLPDPPPEESESLPALLDEPMSLKEYAGVIRDMVKHENDLTNQRLTWMAALNGLMLTGLGFMWGKPFDQVVISVFCLLGLFVCYTAHMALRAAERARFDLYLLWSRRNVPKTKVPPVIGWTKASNLERRLLPWNSLPIAFLVTWAVLFVVNIARP